MDQARQQDTAAEDELLDHENSHEQADADQIVEHLGGHHPPRLWPWKWTPATQVFTLEPT